MSGYPDDDSLDAALAERPLFLRKLFASSLLLARVREVLGQPEKERSPIGESHSRT